MITQAIKNAYEKARERGWNRVYWAIDLHDTCLKSTYGKGNYEFLNKTVVYALQEISNRPETVIILWSSVHKDEEPLIIDFFAKEGIKVKYFNYNPEVANTASGNFDTKFYFNILVDDKAGFDWKKDWLQIYELFAEDDYFGEMNNSF